MKHALFIPLIALFLFSTQLHAHSGGHGKIPALQAIVIAKELGAQFVNNDAGLGFGKLPASWAAVTADKMAIHKQGEGYYIVSVENAEEKKTLYILMSDTGEVYDANFTGTFEGMQTQ